MPALLALCALAFAVARRVGAPIPLEWQEPCMLEHALRVGRGQPVYGEPTIEFAAFPYPPLFHWLGSLFVGAFGEGLAALRLVSVLALMALLLVVQRIGRGAAGLAGAGVVAAAYGWTGFWYDTARVDTLAHGLMAAAWWLVLDAERRGSGEAGLGRAEGGAWRVGVAGLCACLAVLAKQTSLGLLVALGLGLLLQRGRRGLGTVYFGFALLPLAGTVAWLERSTDGWFLWTTVDLLRGSPFHGPAVFGFWVESSWAGVLVVALTVLGRRGWTPVLALGALAMVATGWAGRAHEGGFDNTLMPVAVAAGVVVARLVGRRGELQGRRLMMAGAVVAATSLFLLEDPRPVIPAEGSAGAYRAAEVRLEALTKGGGPVWQPTSAIPVEASGGLHKMALVDLAKSREVEVAARVLGELRQAIAQQRFAAIVIAELPRGGWGDLAADLERAYEVTGALELDAPVSGAAVVPRWIATPRER